MKIKIATAQINTLEVTDEKEQQYLQNIIDKYNRGENPTEEQLQVAMDLVERISNIKIYTDELFDSGTLIITSAFTEEGEIFFEV